MLKKLTLVLWFIVVLIGMSIGSLVGKSAGKSLFSSTKQNPAEMEALLIEGFEKGAKQLNPTLPNMVDNDTRLDKATVGPGARMNYHFHFLSTLLQKSIQHGYNRT